MDDVIEMNLRQAVNVTDTSHIRAAVNKQMQADERSHPAVELVNFHVLVHCTEGNGQHMVDFDNHTLAPGTAIWIRPGQVQQWSDTHDNFHAGVAVFDSSAIPDMPLFEHFAGDTTVTQLGTDSARLQQQMKWLAADLEAHQDHSMGAAVVGVMLRLFARHAQGDHADDTPGRRLAAAFVESVDGNLGQRTVAWHARQIGASTRSVARATAATFDQRPKDVLDARVILEARRRLAWSTDDIAAIARALQFSEASNFTKFFRARTGSSPSAFREASPR